MKRLLIFFTIILRSLFTLFLFRSQIPAGVYKYKDENGAWHYTDTPTDPEQGAAEEIIEDKKVVKEEKDLQKQILNNLVPKNNIEKARNATVIVKTALSRGPGFFITNSGYIITCKHVIQGAEDELDAAICYRKSARFGS
jgi:S1-C subfamily serine protease